MNMDTKKLKWVSILLLIVEIIILPNSAFCKFSEEAAGIMEYGFELAGFYLRKMPDSAMYIINALLECKLTLPQLFKMYTVFFELTETEWSNPLYLGAMIARIILVIFLLFLLSKLYYIC